MLPRAVRLFDGRYPLSGCVLLLMPLWASACASASAGASGASELSVVGAYRGAFVFGSESFESTLQLRHSGPGRVAGAFRVSRPIEIEGVVSGRVVDDLLRIHVTWQGPDRCDGSIEGVLTISEAGGRIEGPVTVSDCTEPVAGRMSFTRRLRAPGAPGARALRRVEAVACPVEASSCR